jgi:putative hydrolase of the HAD superfamily
LPGHPDAETFRLFTALVFSSEGRSIKPSPAIFRRALGHFPSTTAMLFIGDSLERDVIPAKALGLSTVWIAPPGSAHPAADRVVERLPDLA